MGGAVFVGGAVAVRVAAVTPAVSLRLGAAVTAPAPVVGEAVKTRVGAGVALGGRAATSVMAGAGRVTVRAGVAAPCAPPSGVAAASSGVFRSAA